MSRKRRFWSRPAALVSGIVLAVLYLAALAAPFLSPYGPAEQSLPHAYHPPSGWVWGDSGLEARVYRAVDRAAADYAPVGDRSVGVDWFATVAPYSWLGLNWRTKLFQPADPAERIYLLGADATGRDVFTRLLYGARVSLSIGLIGIAITLSLGFLVGGLAGYFGGWVDFILMRSVEFLMAVPGLYLLLALRGSLAPHFDSAQMYGLIVVILAMIGWAPTARIVRGIALSLRQRAYVRAAEAMGQSHWAILRLHFLPNIASYLLVAGTLSIPGYVLGEAALSFLGLGIQEPQSSWGLMLGQTQEDMRVFMLGLWWLMAPGIAIFTTVVAFNVLGDALRDHVDPRMGQGDPRP